MKQLLLILFVGLALFGCGEEDGESSREKGSGEEESLDVERIAAEAIDRKRLAFPDAYSLESYYSGVAYSPDGKDPYTGWAKSTYSNGQLQRLFRYDDGRLRTAHGWMPNGDECPVTKVKKGVGLLLEFDRYSNLPAALVQILEDAGPIILQLHSIPGPEMEKPPTARALESSDFLPSRCIVSIKHTGQGPRYHVVNAVWEGPLARIRDALPWVSKGATVALSETSADYSLAAWSAIEVSLTDLSAHVAKHRDKRVLLLADQRVAYDVVEEVFREIGEGGQVEVLLGASNHHGRGMGEVRVPLPGLPKPGPSVRKMPPFKVRITEEGFVLVNEAFIEDGGDIEMKDLAIMLTAAREQRDQMMRDGRSTREEAELVVEIESHPNAEHQALISVYNACVAAGVREVTPFPSFSPPIEKQLQVKLKQRQKRTAQPTLKSTFKTKAISDIVMPEFNDLDVTDINPVISTSAPSIGDVGTGNDAKGALKGLGLALPKPMQSRCDPKTRISRLVAGGGDRNTETAIMRGLDWLKANQDADGSWGAKDKDDQGNLKPMDKNAMTGMALLCFLGHCELPDSPKYGATVSKAIQFLASTPADAFTGRECYSHPIRTYALCEAYTMTKMKKLESIAKKATEVIIKGQNESGGWAYGYVKGVTAHVDLSVTGWNIQALKAAALTGIHVEGLDEAMDKAVAYVKRCQDSTGKFAYKEGSRGKASLTGAGVLSLQLWKNAKSEEAVKGLDWIIQNQTTEWSKVNVYEWYYHAQACFQATGVAGGTKYWRAWNQDFQKIVLQAQNRDGHWPHGAHFHGDTAIYRTTMTILMLEVYYRYAPMSGGRAD